MSLGELIIVTGLCGSGKSYYVQNMCGQCVPLVQSYYTKRLHDCIIYVEGLIYSGKDVMLESWGWKYPSDKEYIIRYIYFEKNVKQCARNIINDAIRKNLDYSGSRMDALMKSKDHYFPSGVVKKVYKTQFATQMIDEFFKRFPSQYEDEIRNILR